MAKEIIELSSESDGEGYIDRRAILKPVIGHVVDALGGFEGESYKMGDEVNGCLKDLKKLWRKDDTDDERTVARLFWEMRVLPNDLVPILLQTAGKGLVEDKRAISCVDLMTAMTWPIDLAEELKELDEELDKGTDYTQLMQSHLHYKMALLKPGVMQAMFGIMLAPLAKDPKERQERDGQIINVVLHLIRNLVFIKDLPANSHLSSDQVEFSSLQSKLTRALSETHILDLLLTVAANADNDPLFNGWNTLVLEILYLLFRGVKPTSLTIDQKKQPTENLQRLLILEDRNRRDLARKATSRHSRFGTTISVKLNPSKKPLDADGRNTADPPPAASSSSTSRSFVLHRQQAIHGEAGSIMDMTKRQKSKKINKIDELTIEDNLSMEARVILQNLATEFVESCFNLLLKDIRSERPKITEKDNLRLLYVTKWFLEFFVTMQGKEQEENKGEEKWSFGLITEVTERSWIIWVLKRMREAVEEKPKLWTELQAGIECLTQLLLLIDKMSSSELTDPTLREAADVLQQQLIYNGEVLDISLASLKTYKPGTQSLTFLDSSIHLAYALLKMLEKWGKSKGSETYVRQNISKRRRKNKGKSEEDGILDVEEEEEDDDHDIVHETLFTFEAFESKFANAEITHTLLIYLARYRDFTSSENMRRVVGLLHRQAVKSKAEGLFFKASTLDLFKTILSDQNSLPRDQPYKDLINLINYILRQFFKALAEDPFLAVEAFFPKNRGNWKQYSSRDPEEKEKKTVVDARFPPDVEVKKGYSWSDQLGIAIACLIESNNEQLVKWTVEILTQVTSQRIRIIDETDKKDDEPDNDDGTTPSRFKNPSVEALAKITDYMIPYTSDEQADAATKNPNLKLLFRLSKFFILDDDADELEWYVPSGIAIPELQRIRNVVKQFLETPIDLDGKNASQLLSKKRRRRRRRSPSPISDDDAVLSEDEPRRKRKEKKKKEKEQYKSAQFIEDSDEEYGGMEAFLEKEKEQREKTSMAAAAAASAGSRLPTMKATGTKKRRRKAGGEKTSKSLPTEDETAPTPGDLETRDISKSDGSDIEMDRAAPVPRPRPRVAKRRPSSPPPSSEPDERPSSLSPPLSREDSIKHSQRSKRLILSDDDE